MPRKPTPASKRFPEFRSWAREITERARYEKQSGISTDVNGKLARAMERAYQRGFEDAQTGKDSVAVSFSDDPDDPTPVPDSMIRSKIIGAIHSIGLRQFGSRRKFDPSGGEAAAYAQETHLSSYSRRAPDWQLYPPYSFDYEKGVADRTIQQLVKLGILVPASSDHPDLKGRALLVRSPKGVATYGSLYGELP